VLAADGLHSKLTMATTSLPRVSQRRSCSSLLIWN